MTILFICKQNSSFDGMRKKAEVMAKPYDKQNVEKRNNDDDDGDGDDDDGDGDDDEQITFM